MRFKGDGWEFPGRPLVRTLRFHCQGPGLIPGRETKILGAVWQSQKKKEREKKG